MNLRVASAPVIIFLILAAAPVLPGQGADTAVLIRALDAENQSRYDHVLSFTDVEHYAVFRGKDEAHPAAEMTVRMTYQKGTGKSYQILSQSGSELVINHGLRPLLENEKEINDPARVAQAWFTSANYEMKLKAGVPRTIDGRPCVALEVTPRHKAPNMIEGTLWIDARDHSLVEVEGIASQKPSIFAGTTHMMRHYTNMQGYAMATHARAESSSFFFGRTVVTIDYSDYHFRMSGKP